jgi:mono/diheme cytochrome c family protein
VGKLRDCISPLQQNDPIGPAMSGTSIARRFGFVGLVLGLVVVLAIGAFLIAGPEPAIDPIAAPSANSFAPELVKRGATLAAIGNCGACHTAPGGREFAGGRAVPTPFGTIYATNITPDDQTGIGNWSQSAFVRAMRRGVRRDGAYLYPAFPYDHYTLVTDEDDQALYAFLMTRTPVRATPRNNELPFPLNMRSILFGWNQLFLHVGPYRADSGHDATWNRGAYLVEGLGHCGACHTPRNFLAAEKSDQRLAGGESEGWTAYALNAASPAPVRWTAETFEHYLRLGFDESHGAARGPMAEVANDLHAVPAGDIHADIHAMAVYLAEQIGEAKPPAAAIERQQTRQNQRGVAGAANTADSQASVAHAQEASSAGEGAAIYVSACAGCHEGPRTMPFGGIDLALSSGIAGPTPANLFNVVLYGLPAADTSRAPIMPGFAAVMNDSQLTALARYLRARFTDMEPWPDIEQSLRAARSPGRAGTVRSATSVRLISADTMQRPQNEAQR